MTEPSRRKTWETLKTAVLNPKLDESELEERLGELKQRLPTPVFWLLGKAQSGKTSLIRALTGDSRAEIGDGIRPCTRTAYVYDFPNPQNSLVRFLDTRGLGEVDYDPSEDMGVFQQQAHLLMVVMKALDHAQHTVLEAVRTIVHKNPHWPVLVVQTTLHEGYPDPRMEHILPYPYAQSPWPPAVPDALARSLDRQREAFQGIPDVRFVAVDFTLPEDGYEPVNYGLDALWSAIEEALSLGLRSLIQTGGDIEKQLKDAYSKAAHPHIVAYAVAAAGAAAVPIPFLDIPLVTAVQAKMLQTIASLYNQKTDMKRLSEIGSALGIGLLSNLGRRELVKFIPVYGTAVSSLWTGATTYALGKTLSAYFSYSRRGLSPDTQLFEQLYAEQLQEGRRLLKDYIKNLNPAKSS